MYNLSSILIIILGIFQSELNWVDFCDESVVPWLTFGNRSTNPDNWCYNADLPAGLHNSTGCKVCHAFLGNWQTDHIEITLGKNLKTFKFQKIVRTRGYCRCLCPCHTSTALIPTSQIRQKKMMIIFSSTFSLFPSFHYFRLSFCSFFLSFFSLSLSLSLLISFLHSLFLSFSRIYCWLVVVIGDGWSNSLPQPAQEKANKMNKRKLPLHWHFLRMLKKLTWEMAEATGRWNQSRFFPLTPSFYTIPNTTEWCSNPPPAEAGGCCWLIGLLQPSSAHQSPQPIKRRRTCWKTT